MELSTLHDARKKSLDVVKDAETQYPRQGLNILRFLRWSQLRQPAVVRIPVRFLTQGSWRHS